MLTGRCGGGATAGCAVLRSTLLVAPLSGARRALAVGGGSASGPDGGRSVRQGIAAGLARSASRIFICRGSRAAMGVRELLVVTVTAPCCASAALAALRVPWVCCTGTEAGQCKTCEPHVHQSQARTDQ